MNTEINLDEYIEDKLFLNMLWANIFSLIVFIIFSIILGGSFYLIWHQKINIFPEVNIDDKKRIFLFLQNFSISLIVFIIGLILHELIHGLFYLIFTKNKFKSIKFGLKLKYGAAYCLCTELLKVKYSIISTIMPAIILGFIPGIIAVITGNLFLLIFAIVFISAGAGDFLIVMKLFKEDKENYVLDVLGEKNYMYIYRKKSPNKNNA